MVDEKTGEVLVECNTELSEEVLAQTLVEAGVSRSRPCTPTSWIAVPFISDTLRQDTTRNELEALVEIYRMMRPGEPPTKESAENFVPEPVLLSRPLRPVGGGPHEVQPSTGPRATSPAAACWTSEDIVEVTENPGEDIRNGAVWWTISTTWATAACAP